MINLKKSIYSFVTTSNQISVIGGGGDLFDILYIYIY